MKSIDIDCLIGEVFCKFIDYAIEKSDSFMLARNNDCKVNYNRILESIIKEEKDLKQKGFLDKKNSKRICDEKDYCEKIKNDYCNSILNMLHPYEIRRRDYAVMWPLNVNSHPDSLFEFFDSINQPYNREDYLFHSIFLFKACKETGDIIKNVSTKMKDWDEPTHPKDLSFFKNGNCWLATCIHENMVFIILDNYEEYGFLEKMGIIFHEYDVDWNNDNLLTEEFFFESEPEREKDEDEDEGMDAETLREYIRNNQPETPVFAKYLKELGLQ